MKKISLHNKLFTRLLLTSVLLFSSFSLYASGQTQFFHHDGLGSVVNLSDSNGQIQSRSQYDAWGHKRYDNSTSWNRFGFTGHEHDQETNLIYAKARYLDPDQARFLSQDNWEGDINIAPSLHRYLYAYQNPTVYVDTDGNKSVFGDATKQIEEFKEYLGDANEDANSQLAAVGIGTAQFVASLGEGITRPLDIAANLAQTAAGVDDQQVRDELAGTKKFVKGTADFVVNGDYAQSAKNVGNTIADTARSSASGNVTATANLTQGLLAAATLRSASKGRGAIVKESSTGPGAKVSNNSNQKISEVGYKKRVERLESIYGSKNVHSLEKHGAQTSGLAQYRRVKNANYPNPTTGSSGRRTKNASKFLTNKDHYETLRSAILQHKKDPTRTNVSVKFDRNIGVNIKNLGTHDNKGPYSANYVDNAVVNFDLNSGKFFTAYPTP
jgi:RHS repeat-associated protein